MKSSTRKILFITALISVLYISTLNSDLGWLGGDNAQYILLAKSLSSGQGYRAINLPNSPPYTQVPFLFPLLLSPIVYFFGYNFFLMHLLIVIMALFLPFLVYKTLKIHTTEEIAILSALLTGITPYLVAYLVMILTEIPYLVFSFLAFLYIDKYFKSSEVLDRCLILCVFFMLAASFTRTIGVLIYISLLLFFLINKKIKKLIYVSIVYLIPLLLWNLRNYMVNKQDAFNYLNQFLLINPYSPDLGKIKLINLMQRLFQNIIFYKNMINETIFPHFQSWLGNNNIISWIIFLILLGGFLYKIIKERSNLEFYFLFYLIFVLIWPCKELSRYILPIFPFLFFYFFVGIITSLKIIKRKVFIKPFYYSLASITIILVTLSNALETGKIIKTYNSNFYYPSAQRLINWSHYFEINLLKDEPQKLEVLYKFVLANLWLKDNINKDVIVLSRKPTITSLLSGHKSVIYPFSLNSDSVIKFIQENKVDYLIIDESDESLQYLIPAIKKNLIFFEPIVYLEEIIIVKLKHKV